MTIQRMLAQLGPLDIYSRTVPIVASTPAPVEGEALTSWDLERFAKNPVVLWGHDGDALPIGLASDVVFDPTFGLKMNITFARAEMNPLAEQVFQGVRDTFIRAVSVGYDYVDEAGNRSESPTPRVRLVEVSFVAIGKDEDAGTPAINPAASSAEPIDEDTRKRVTEAASVLAKHRAKVRAAAVRTDASDLAEGEVLRMDRMPIRLDAFDRTPAGGRKIPARLSRTGVLVYVNPDGTTRRELRLSEEIFKADSLATLEDAVVIDIKDHTGLVTPESWKKASLGHVSAVRQDGKFIVGTLVVEDGAALAGIANGERTEISSGYRCRLDMTPGVFEGERYDCIQRNIRYNHVALCPPNRGRAGPEVGLRLDGKGPAWGVSHNDEKEIEMKIIRLDGKDIEFGSDKHIETLESMHKRELEQVRTDAKSEVEKANTEKTDLQKRLDAAEGARDAASKEVEALKLDATAKQKKFDEEKEQAQKSESSRVLRRVRLMRMALRFFDDDKEMDEEKMDGMTDREIHLAVIKKRDASFTEDGKSDDYVQSRFDSICQFAKNERGIDGVVRAAEDLKRFDAAGAGENPVDAARKKRDQAYADAFKISGAAPAK